MRAAQRTSLALIACCVACCCPLWCGCTLFGSHSAPPAAIPAGTVYYEPPVPLTRVPAGETPSEPPPTGWAKLEPVNIWASWKAAWGQGPKEAIARDLYAQGDALYRAKDYLDAAKKYGAAAKRWPDTTLEENALFMSGEAYFFANRYSDADDQYGLVLKKYSNSRYTNIIVARQFAIGVYWVQCDHVHPHFSLTPNFTDKTRPTFDTFGYAVKEFDFVRINDPRNKLADEATMDVANAYFLRGDYDDADYYYKLVRTEYPKSIHQKDAHLLGIQAKLRRYQGTGYDDRPLKEAEDLTDQTLAQFGRELGDERERLVTTKGEIHAQMAVRNWSVAQFYEKGAHYAAARVYYNEIVKEYPQTELAQQSRDRLVAIKTLPDNPVDHFEFLAVIFDGKDPNKDKEDAPRSGPDSAAAVATRPIPAGYIAPSRDPKGGGTGGDPGPDGMQR